jgi:hypothetical protein
MATKSKVVADTAAKVHSGDASAKSRDKQDGGITTWWRDLPDHQRAGYAGFITTVFAALCGAGLIALWTPHAALAPVGEALRALCGWGAYPLVLGLLAAGVLRMAESFARRPLAPRWLPVEILTLWLVALAASGLFLGGGAGGLVGALLAGLLAPLPRALVGLLLFVTAFLLLLAIFGVTPGRLARLAYRGVREQQTPARRQDFTPPRRDGRLVPYPPERTSTAPIRWQGRPSGSATSQEEASPPGRRLQLNDGDLDRDGTVTMSAEYETRDAERAAQVRPRPSSPNDSRERR